MRMRAFFLVLLSMMCGGIIHGLNPFILIKGEPTISKIISGMALIGVGGMSGYACFKVLKEKLEVHGGIAMPGHTIAFWSYKTSISALLGALSYATLRSAAYLFASAAHDITS